MTVSYITPIMDRTYEDVEYARENQSDLENKNKGAWNYTDANRVCNNLKYAAEYMYEKGFLSEPYTIQVKLDWKETDVMTYEELNSMIVQNINNLKTYSRSDLEWYPIASIANMDYNMANWIEKDIHLLATQLPKEPDTYKLTVKSGLGSGDYKANTTVRIQADAPETGLVFDHWSGDHLENIKDGSAAITEYIMPHQDITLEAHYVGTIPHRLTVITYSGTETYDYGMGKTIDIEADPAPYGKVFHHWIIEPDAYEKNLYEPAASTHFTMPNEEVTLTAVYITPGDKHLIVENGNGSGWYFYGDYVPVSPNVPSGATFTRWTGNTQYLTGSDTSAYNTVLIPDATPITIRANWSYPPGPPYIPAKDVPLTVVNGLIQSTGTMVGKFDEGTRVTLVANADPVGYVFTHWSIEGGASFADHYQSGNRTAAIIIGRTESTVTANYRLLEYYDLTLTTHSGTTTKTYEREDYFSVNGNPAPDGYTFLKWTGDTYSYGGSGFRTDSVTTGTYMGPANRRITAEYRILEYFTLTVKTASGTTSRQVEREEYFTVYGDPPPEGYVFEKWTGDIEPYRTSGFATNSVSAGTYMGTSNRTIEAQYRPILPHTLTVRQPSGDVTYTQNEFTTISVTAENVPGKRFTYWSSSGKGYLKYTSLQTDIYTFGNGDGVITPNYVNIWTISVENGTISSLPVREGGGGYIQIIETSDTRMRAIVDEGALYRIYCRPMEVYEGFGGWTQIGPGTIYNTASSSTKFTVGSGDATLTAHVIEYPDKTLTIYEQNPDTGAQRLISKTTYRYGSTVSPIVAPIAPDKTTFLSWLGDVSILATSALASTTKINSLTINAEIIATYFYPESPQYYTLTIYNGWPESGTYAAGSLITIRANIPNQGWEFFQWTGDTQYLVNPDVSQSENQILMPLKAVTLYAKYKVIGELPLYRVSVLNGIAKGTYTDSRGVVHNEEGVYIDVPEGIEIQLIADDDPVGKEFDYWGGNFIDAGVTDINTRDRDTKFTMVAKDINATAYRKDKNKVVVYTTNANGPGEVYENTTHPINGNLVNTDEEHYQFIGWTCVDANNVNCISAIEKPQEEATNINVGTKSLWIEAKYTVSYRLTVVKGQDTGDHYYYDGEEVVDKITADAPELGMQFDHWEDPVGVCVNIYDPTPKIIMKDSIATITAVYTSQEAGGNSIVVTGNDLHTNIITKTRSQLVNGIYAVGTIVFDLDGCVGVITQEDPDQNDDTDDYKTIKLFYGGNV